MSDIIMKETVIDKTVIDMFTWDDAKGNTHTCIAYEHSHPDGYLWYAIDEKGNVLGRAYADKEEFMSYWTELKESLENK
jgi:hypothetical protein